MIIAASRDHLDKILEIERSAFKTPWTESQFKNDLDRIDIAINLVNIHKSGDVNAYLFGYQVMDEFHVNNIAVDPDFRQKRIASNMLDYLIDQMRNNGIKSIYLEVSAENLAAINLYLSKGFTKTGIRKDYYSKGDSAILFTLELKPND